ncbi:MAG TPA: hypothetical protein EYQ00_12340, partial [Dehalococcoidia bacterium]|nr:hypothetical protein [Dehalococcoidia bacterium]
MSKDFLAGQIRTTQIISSGSQAGKPSLLIVSASDSTSYNGEAIDNSTLLADVGTDVFLFVTGSKTDPSGFSAFPSGPRQNVTLFGGDVVISGTMFAEHSMIEVDGNVTGSMSISGSLFVSRSISINEGLTVNESGEAGAENDFRVETSNFTHAIFADASTDQILIHTSSEAGSDVSFYISGSVGGKDSATHKGVSLFAGDVVVSGTVYGPDGRELGAEHVGWFTGSAGNNVGGGAGAGWISTTGSLAVSGSDLYISQYIKHIGDTNTNIAFENDVVKIMAGDMGVLATDPSEDVVLIGSHGGASTKFGRVLILSGGAAGSANESNASDLNFFVSGTIGSKDSASVRGTAVFGGDMVVSGGLDVHGATFVVDEVNDRVGINTTRPTVAL